MSSDRNWFVGKRTQRRTAADFSALPDFADQSVLLIGPRRHHGVAQQPIEFELRDLVAFAGALSQRFVVEDRDVAAPIADQTGFLQTSHHIGDRRSPYPEHHPEEF